LKLSQILQNSRNQFGHEGTIHHSSFKGDNYYQLLVAFKETHEEDRLALLNNRLKALNNWLENSGK